VLHGTSHVKGTGLPEKDVTADLVAEVRTGRAASEVELALGWHEYRCDVAARLGESGDLVFAPGQHCALEVAEPEVRGRVEASLQSGRGRLMGGWLELELTFEVSGALRTHVAGRRVVVLGTEIELPDTWMPELPVSGTVSSSARGPREEH